MAYDRRAADRAYRQRNREKIRLKRQTPEYRAKMAARMREIRAKDPDFDRKYYEKNREKVMVKVAARCRRAKQATPAWLTRREKAQIRALYAQARALGLQVDHIHPLTHPLVCGLHVPWNLQLLEPDQNLSKHNVFIPETTYHGH